MQSLLKIHISFHVVQFVGYRENKVSLMQVKWWKIAF